MKSSTVPLHYPKACETKTRTDALGGVKIAIRGASAYGYPHYKSLRGIPNELRGIDPDVWAGLFMEIDRIQDRSNGNECIGILVLLLGVIVFMVLQKLLGNVWIAIVGAISTWIATILVVPTNPKGTRQSLDDLLLMYEPKFRDQGWKVSCHTESTPAGRRGSHTIWVVHFVPLSNEP